MGSEVGTEFRSGNATTEWLTECVPRCIRGMSSSRYFPPTHGSSHGVDYCGVDQSTGLEL